MPPDQTLRVSCIFWSALFTDALAFVLRANFFGRMFRLRLQDPRAEKPLASANISLSHSLAHCTRGHRDSVGKVLLATRKRKVKEAAAAVQQNNDVSVAVTRGGRAGNFAK